jgi:predicted permease
LGFWRDLEARIQALPGVVAVGSSHTLPFTHDQTVNSYAWDGESESAGENLARIRRITGGYFRAMQTRVLAGRPFTGTELTGRSSSIIVDEILARKVWPNEDPIGKTLLFGGSRRPLEVVGVVESVHERWLSEQAHPSMYVPYASGGPRIMNLIVRGSGDLGSLITPIRNEIRSLDPGIALTEVTLLEELVDRALAPTRFTSLLLSIFAGLALVLAAVGLYGVIAYSVSQRTAEIGMRMALGADKVRVFRLVVGRAVALISLGAAIGVTGTLGLSRFASSVIHGVSTTDPMTLVVVALVLSAAGILASYMPARRAMSVDPVTALRGE